jgi:hypothetical protein
LPYINLLAIFVIYIALPGLIIFSMLAFAVSLFAFVVSILAFSNENKFKTGEKGCELWEQCSCDY